MSQLDDRYERGRETRKMFGGGQVTGGSSPAARELAPDLERILGKALFGHMTLYAGIPFASGAMDLANEIFASD